MSDIKYTLKFEVQWEDYFRFIREVKDRRVPIWSNIMPISFQENENNIVKCNMQINSNTPITQKFISSVLNYKFPDIPRYDIILTEYIGNKKHRLLTFIDCNINYSEETGDLSFSYRYQKSKTFKKKSGKGSEQDDWPEYPGHTTISKPNRDSS